MFILVSQAYHPNWRISLHLSLNLMQRWKATRTQWWNHGDETDGETNGETNGENRDMNGGDKMFPITCLLLL